MRKPCIDIVFNQTLYTSFLESNRPVGFQPLVESAHSRSPLPAIDRFRFQHQFFTDSLGVLLLHDGINVSFRKILVQIHLVVQILETSHTAQNKVVCLMFQIQSTVQQVTLVATFTVVRYFSDIFTAVFCLVIGTSGIFVWISSLIGIFIIQREVQLQIFRRQINGAETSSELIVCINALVVEVVLEETSLVFVEESRRKRKL